MKKSYGWKPGRSLPLDPEAAGLAIEALPKPTASAILAAAKPEDSPLHPAFEWDDSEAAHQYRLHQAREIPRRLMVTITPAPDAGATRVLDAFINLPPDRGRSEGVYVSPLGLTETEANRARSIILRQISGLESTLRSLDAACCDDRWMDSIAGISQHIAKAKDLAASLP
jgi:hypothetical protein